MRALVITGAGRAFCTGGDVHDIIGELPHVVLLGDAAHTAHVSVGSGTRMAMEHAVALAAALHDTPDLPAALAAYERRRRPAVESLQGAAQASLQWFEETERYLRRLPPVRFTAIPPRPSAC